MGDKFEWIACGLNGSDFHDLRDGKNRILGWVRPRETGFTYWISAEGVNPRTCPCTTLEEAKRFVEAQYLLVK